MNKNEMKTAVLQAIEENKQKIFELKNNIYQNPEFGYKETKTTQFVWDFFTNELHLSGQKNIAITGCKIDVNEEKQGPCIAVMGELDAISCKEHKDSNELGASHTCGHNLQIAGMAGAALGLVKSGVLPMLEGKLCFIATPAEEFIELDFREQLKKNGEITYFGGKQELIYRGVLDNVDMAMMFHALDIGDKKALIGPESNGFIGKKVHFKGKESHAGSAPHEGINALNAAMLAINNVNALRETFQEKDRVRFHPIITKGGDIVNVVPADVQMESYVRARTTDSMADANKKVNQALKAGGMAIGAEVEITEIPGYLPILKQPDLDDLMRENLILLGAEGKIIEGGDFTGSFDFGDISHIMPAIHPMFGGIKGALHTRDFEVIDEETACILPAKAMALTIVDLLYDNAQKAKDILAHFTPVMTKQQYLEFQKNNDRTL